MYAAWGNMDATMDATKHAYNLARGRGPIAFDETSAPGRVLCDGGLCCL